MTNQDPTGAGGASPDEFEILRQEVQRKRDQDAAETQRQHRQDLSPDESAAWLRGHYGGRLRFSTTGPGGAVLEAVSELRDLRSSPEALDDGVVIARALSEAAEVYLMAGGMFVNFADGVGVRIFPLSGDEEPR